MAQEMVVKEPFTEEMKKDGETLTKLLDQNALEIVGSFWWFFPESSEWRLVLVTPDIDAKGPRAVYESIQRVLSENSDEFSMLNLQNISVISASDTVFNMLRSVLKTGPHISSVRVSRSSFNNIFVEDAFIYRLQ